MADRVRAKFVVNAIERTAGVHYPHRTEDGKTDYGRPEKTELHTIKMSPVSGNNDPEAENSKFWAASPSGSLQLGCVNPEAVKLFTLHGEYYVDFTPAPVAEKKA